MIIKNLDCIIKMVFMMKCKNVNLLSIWIICVKNINEYYISLKNIYIYIMYNGF